MKPDDSPPTRDASDDIVEHFHHCTFADLPASTVEKAKLLFLDTLGAALAAREAEGCRSLHDLVSHWGGAPQATLLGFTERVPAHHAVLVNATRARALELDDVHELGLVHATATMVPVAIAAAELQGGASGRDVLTAAALGIDLSCRLGLSPTLSLGGASYRPRSISRSYTTGTLAGSLVAARLAGMDLEGMKDAFGNAYSQCAGNQQGLSEGTLTVRTQQGVCAQSAIMSMEMARIGISGTRRSLEGKFGYFEAFWRNEYDRNALLGDLGKRFEVDQVSVKPYACCKYSHTGIAAGIEIGTELRADPAFRIDDIEQVKVHVASTDCWELLCAPLEEKSSPVLLAGPRGWALAQFSFPYAIACALARGQFTIAELTQESRTADDILGLLKKVTPVLDERGVVELPEPGDIEVRLRSGQTLRNKVKLALGHPDRPMSTAQMIDKFTWCASHLPEARARQLAERVLDLENVDDIREVIQQCVK